jgi:hypothetical protein
MSGRLYQESKMQPKIKSIVLWLLAMICIVAVFYLTVFRYFDATNCYYSAGRRIGAPPPYYGIADYASSALKPGMSRAEAHSVLSRMGKVIVLEEAPYKSDVLVGVEEIEIRMCAYPLNNPRITLRFDRNWILISAHFLGE